MRGHVLVLFLAACGFSPTNTATTGPGIDGAATVDTLGSTGSGSGSGSGCPDADADGVCDAVDDWPCGVKPNDPGSFQSHLTGQGLFEVNQVKLQGQDTRLVVVTTNQGFALGLDYAIHIVCLAGTTCHADLEDGTDKSGKKGCIFDGNVTGDGFSVGTGTGTYNTTMSFPTANRYELRLMPAKTGSCGPNWVGAAPGSGETIAYVCVH